MNITLFDLAEAAQLKKQGMQAAASYPLVEPIEIAKNIALMLAQKDGEVYADKVREHMATGNDFTRKCLEELNTRPNAFGSIFQSPKLKFSGRIRESSKTSRHLGVQRIWCYENGN